MKNINLPNIDFDKDNKNWLKLQQKGFKLPFPKKIKRLQKEAGS